jgi:hypothetical protein
MSLSSDLLPWLSCLAITFPLQCDTSSPRGHLPWSLNNLTSSIWGSLFSAGLKSQLATALESTWNSSQTHSLGQSCCNFGKNHWNATVVNVPKPSVWTGTRRLLPSKWVHFSLSLSPNVQSNDLLKTWNIPRCVKVWAVFKHFLLFLFFFFFNLWFNLLGASGVWY